MNQPASAYFPQWLIDATHAAYEQSLRWKPPGQQTPWDQASWHHQQACMEIVRAAVPFILAGHPKEHPHDRMDP